MSPNPQRKPTLEFLRERKADILALARAHGVQNLRVFGSIVRGEEQESSDVDFLVDVEPGRSMLDMVAFWQDVQELLQQKVDVVSEPALHWYIRDRVLSEAVQL
ncbi:MAG: nucleotidyltransferase family protein [Deltaproteobacteria bacterium]|nr:nucleotidyltransferase family protein [Deltaproteobacteria bacterium]